MSKAKFTPPPWGSFPPWAPTEVKSDIGHPSADESQLIPVVRLGQGRNRDANARLIEASPEMYHLICEFLAKYDLGDELPEDHPMTKGRRLIERIDQ